MSCIAPHNASSGAAGPRVTPFVAEDPAGLHPAAMCWVDVDVHSATITVRGEVDHFSAPALTEAGRRLLEGPGTPVTISLSEVTFADGAIVSAVAALRKAAESASRRLLLVDVPAGVARVMGLAGAEELLHGDAAGAR